MIGEDGEERVEETSEEGAGSWAKKHSDEDMLCSEGIVQ